MEHVVMSDRVPSRRGTVRRIARLVAVSALVALVAGCSLLGGSIEGTIEAFFDGINAGEYQHDPGNARSQRAGLQHRWNNDVLDRSRAFS